MDKKYQVFVSSTYEDLKEERLAVFSSLLDNNCIPVGMEQFPASPLSQWEYITKMIDNSDYFLLIVAGRYGSLDAETGVSYTEKEFNYARSKGIPVLAFLHSNPENLIVSKTEQNDSGREKLVTFRKNVENSKMHINYYKDANELKYRIASSLPKIIVDVPAIGWVRADQIENDKHFSSVSKSTHPNLSAEAKQLLREACNDDSGQILKIRTLGGVSISTHQMSMIPDDSARTVASWEAAIEELLDQRMIIAAGKKDEVFRVTKKGYDYNDLLRKHNGWIF